MLTFVYYEICDPSRIPEACGLAMNPRTRLNSTCRTPGVMISYVCLADSLTIRQVKISAVSLYRPLDMGARPSIDDHEGCKKTSCSGWMIILMMRAISIRVPRSNVPTNQCVSNEGYTGDSHDLYQPTGRAVCGIPPSGRCKRSPYAVRERRCDGT